MYEFRRPQEIYHSKNPSKKYFPCLFTRKADESPHASAEDAIQGNLSNCYLISPIAALSSLDLVPRLFNLDYHPLIGIVSINLCIDGKWAEYVIDDFLPA